MEKIFCFQIYVAAADAGEAAVKLADEIDRNLDVFSVFDAIWMQRRPRVRETMQRVG